MKLDASSAIKLSVSAFLVLSGSSARAALSYNIYESVDGLVIEASGSLALPSPGLGDTSECSSVFGGNTALLYPPYGGFAICPTPSSEASLYSISGPTFFPGVGQLFNASSTSGVATVLLGISQQFGIDDTYVSGNPISSRATFAGRTLADYGWTPSTGLLGTWTLTGTEDTISVQVTGGPSAEVPGPLPVLGAGAAFGFSRRLRQRTQRSQVASRS